MTSASAAIPQQPGRTKAFLRLVMIEHSIFALPFAYIAALTAMFQLDGNIHWVRLLLVTICMVGLRTFAMAVNRIIDREIDARNPRTAHRELVTGAMSVRHAWTGALIAVVVFLGSAALLNPLCLALAPVAVIPMVVYPYGKRFTNYPQAILGLAQAMGPVGGWLAITGEWSWEAVVLGLAVGVWIGGFDLIYACQDVEVDRRIGVHSTPARFGVRTALHISTVTHVLCFALFVWFGQLAGFSWAWWAGLLVTGAVALKWRDLLLHAFDPIQAKAVGLRVNLLHYGLLCLISLTVVGALKAVGVILCIAMLIAPGAIAFLLTRRFGAMLALAVIIALIASFLGVYLSFFLDSAPAPTIVVLLSIAFIVAFAWSVFATARIERTSAAGGGAIS